MHAPSSSGRERSWGEKDENEKCRGKMGAPHSSVRRNLQIVWLGGMLRRGKELHVVGLETGETWAKFAKHTVQDGEAGFESAQRCTSNDRGGRP